MSTGPRISRGVALAAAHHLERIWGLGSDCAWCGSLRRGAVEVGDLDLLVPVAGAGRDGMFAAIDATIERDGVLFGLVGRPIGRAIRGHKPGFLEAAYELHLAEPLPKIQLRISRYTPDNLGWQAVMRTGPAGFCDAFLARWKRTWSFPLGALASVGGHLRDTVGRIVPVPTELEAFRLCGFAYVDPPERDEWARRIGLDMEHRA